MVYGANKGAESFNKGVGLQDFNLEVPKQNDQIVMPKGNDDLFYGTMQPKRKKHHNELFEQY